MITLTSKQSNEQAPIFNAGRADRDLPEEHPARPGVQADQHLHPAERLEDGHEVEHPEVGNHIRR